MHIGAPKIWYGVPSNERGKFEKAAKTKLASLFKQDPNILLDIVTMISPAYLQSQGVTVYKTQQMPGEFIVTFPQSYHSGFSLGLNIGEAVNFATPSWFDHASKGYSVYRKCKELPNFIAREKIPVFPLEWLVVENIRNYKSIDLSKQSFKKVNLSS